MEAAHVPVQASHGGVPRWAPAPGGVAQSLDYDIHTMASFCAWVVFSLFKCTNPNCSPHFQSLLQSVLNATRLPKSTILLGIHYVSVRVDTDTQPCHVESQIFEALIVGLLLANKFNDDNTFKNRSWSEATGLPLDKINDLEREWLKDCFWRLHDDSQYILVESCWTTWCQRLSTAAPAAQMSPVAVPATAVSSIPTYPSSEPTTPFTSGYGYSYPVNVAPSNYYGYYQQYGRASVSAVAPVKAPVNYYGYAAVY